MGTRRRSLNAYGNIDSGIFYQLESGGGFWHIAADYRPLVFALLVDGQTKRTKTSITLNQSLEPTAKSLCLRRLVLVAEQFPY
jgi:hypothetical protein